MDKDRFYTEFDYDYGDLVYDLSLGPKYVGRPLREEEIVKLLNRYHHALEEIISKTKDINNWTIGEIRDLAHEALDEPRKN